MTEQQCREVLERINDAKPKKFFLDTDAANEIDDQFAIAYAMLSDDIELIGLGAAPFSDDYGTMPGEGVVKSYEEMVRVRDLTLRDSGIPTYMGAGSYLPDTETPVDSEAARAIVDACRSTDDLVFVASIGCYTDMASAILMAPDITKNMVVLLIGGLDIDACDNGNDYNLAQDKAAARVIMESGVRLILLPAFGGGGGTVVLTLTALECAAALEDRNIPVGDYLTGLMRKRYGIEKGSVMSRTHIIWDISSVAVLKRDGGFWDPEIRDAVSVDGEGFYRPVPGKMIYNRRYDRDGIFTDLFLLILEKADKK